MNAYKRLPSYMVEALYVYHVEELEKVNRTDTFEAMFHIGELDKLRKVLHERGESNVG